MATKRPRPLSCRVSKRAHGNCAAAYFWLRRRYWRLQALMRTHHSVYRAMTAVMTAEGIHGKHGQPLTPRGVRQIWLRVCYDAEQGTKIQLARRLAVPTSWRPTTIAPAKPPLPSTTDQPEGLSFGKQGRVIQAGLRS